MAECGTEIFGGDPRQSGHELVGYEEIERLVERRAVLFAKVGEQLLTPFGTGFDLFGLLTLAKPIDIAGVLPTRDIGRSEMRMANVGELLDNRSVGNAVVEHDIDGFANRGREPGNFSGSGVASLVF